MKIRSNYVSNSSSSSFCIVGAIVDDRHFDKTDSICKILVNEGFDKNEVDEMDVSEIVNSIYNHFYGSEYEKMFGEIEIVTGIENYRSDTVIAGLNVWKMNDDETLGQFKEKVCEQLRKMGFTGDRNDINIYVDGGYEG